MDGLTGTPPGKRPCVVILEDDHGVRRSLQLLLQARGFEVKAYASPSALLADPAVMDAYCLISDFCLGDINGIAVLETLRQRAWTGPAMLMTAYGSADLNARAQAAGYTEILDKPFKEHALVNALARISIG
jgi:FixJ family two-component response regulator